MSFKHSAVSALAITPAALEDRARFSRSIRPAHDQRTPCAPTAVHDSISSGKCIGRSGAGYNTVTRVPVVRLEQACLTALSGNPTTALLCS